MTGPFAGPELTSNNLGDPLLMRYDIQSIWKPLCLYEEGMRDFGLRWPSVHLKKALCQSEGLFVNLTRPSVGLKRSALCLRESAVGIKESPADPREPPRAKRWSLGLGFSNTSPIVTSLSETACQSNRVLNTISPVKSWISISVKWSHVEYFTVSIWIRDVATRINIEIVTTMTEISKYLTPVRRLAQVQLRSNRLLGLIDRTEPELRMSGLGRVIT